MQLRRFIFSCFLLLVYLSGYAHNLLFYESKNKGEHTCDARILPSNNHLLLHHLSDAHQLDLSFFLSQVGRSTSTSFWEFLFDYLIEKHDPDSGCDLDGQLLPLSLFKLRFTSDKTSAKGFFAPLLLKHESLLLFFLAANGRKTLLPFFPERLNASLFAFAFSRRGPPFSIFFSPRF